jgi:nucleotide-binding universal stress UspA family protein
VGQLPQQQLRSTGAFSIAKRRGFCSPTIDKDVERNNTMFKRMLVPLDGSELAERAIPVAARIARASGGTIVFVRVVLPPVEFGTYSVEQEHLIDLKPSAFERRLAEAESYLLNIAITHADVLADIATETDIVTGATAPEIISTARLEEIDLIVMCSHGETGLKRWVFGSVAQEAVRHSPVPMLVLNEHGSALPAPDAAHPLRILVALDGSVQSETILEPAVQLIAALAAPAWGVFHLLHIVDLPPVYGKLRSQAHMSNSMQAEARQEAETYLKVLADRLNAETPADLELTITSSVAVSTDVAGTIIKTAEQAEGPEHLGDYDLIAMATHGREGLQRLVMGSVTEHVLGATKLPLLMVRPKEADAAPVEAGETTKTTVSESPAQTWVGLF